MNKQIKKLWLRFFCTGILCLLMVLPFLGLPVKAENTQLQERYLLGTDISIPTVSFETDSGTIVATAMIEMPSGNVCRVEDSFLPTQEGLHILTYVGYDEDGKQYMQHHKFTVVPSLYAVGAARSSVRYGCFAYGNYVIDRPAVLTSIASADKFSYSEIIDLKALNGESFLEFFVTPENIGTNDVGKIDIVLTDLYDTDNFVTISIKKGTAGQAGAAWAEKTSYVTANASSQQPTGLEKGKGTLEIGEMVYSLHKGDIWGANVIFALPGNPAYVSLDNPQNDPNKVGSQTMALQFDVQTNTIYANGQLVTMLSDSVIYGADVWQGFTTGECLLTIQGSNYNASALNLAITKLGSHTAKADEALLTENIFVDTQAPAVVVELPEEGCPNGVVGRAYKLFAATAKDDYTSDLQVKTAVYFNYETDKQVQVDIADGSFVPFIPGVYTLFYSGTDRYGNVGTSEIAITVEAADAAILDVQIADPANGVVGQIYNVAIPEIQNNRGAFSWQATATHTQGLASYTVTAEEPSFFPEYAGTYQLTYSFGDYICTDTVTKTVDIAVSDVPVFFEDPVIPSYLLYGCIYELPKIDARVYSTGEPAACTPDIYVVEDGAQERKADYRFVSYAKESIQIIYRMENNGKTEEYRSAVIPVKNVGYNGTYQIAEYFNNNGVVADARNKFIRFTPESEGQEPVSTTFINALQTFDFSARFAASGRGVEKINLYLTDASDSSVVVKMTYRQERRVVYFSINDGQEERLYNTTFNDPDMPLSLNVTNGGVIVMPTGTSVLQYEVKTDLAGKAFNGFTDKLAYLTVELEGITNKKQAGVDIYSLCGQMISGIYVDNIKPMISASAAAGARPCGTEFVVPAVYYRDVLDPVAVCTMSVLAPDGSVAVANDGTVLNELANPGVDYTLNLAQHGNYTVNYQVKDTAGNELVFSYVINSADVIAPQVEILSPTTTGSVNTRIPVAQISITDNNDTLQESFVVYSYVVTPYGQSYALLDSSQKQVGYFTATHAGVYSVNYMVMDSVGNLTIASYEVEIS